MATHICMFNHKGGVSKTTTAYHLGWMLHEKGKRVLLVDADSQCNLTSIALGEEEFEEFFVNNPGRNLKTALSPAFDAKPMLLEAVECVTVKEQDGLFLLPGSFELSEYDVSLGISFTLTDAMMALKNLPGSFFYLLDRTAKRYDVDYVIIDMNPSLSAINQALLISADFFIVPTSPDRFSILAVRSLAKVLPRWEQWATRARQVFKDASYPLPKRTPRLLGTIIQNYNIRNGQPVAPARRIIEELHNMVRTTLFPELNKINMTFPIEAYSEDNLCLALIANFQALNNLYQTYGMPVFALSDGQFGYTGTVLEGAKERASRFKEAFSELADKIIQLVSHDNE